MCSGKVEIIDFNDYYVVVKEMGGSRLIPWSAIRSISVKGIRSKERP
jgi:hypothetical protein